MKYLWAFLVAGALMGDVIKEETKIVGLQMRTSNALGKGDVDIPALWEKFLSENIMDQIPSKTSNEVIALYTDYENDYTQDYTIVIGCPVSGLEEVPEGLVMRTIPAGRYEEFQAVGDHPQALIQTWDKIWSSKNLKRTYTGDYEVYGSKFFNDPKQVDIFIAVE